MHYHEYRHEMKNPHFKKAMERISELEAENAALRRERELERRVSELEEENRRMREALEQCLGNLKALGAENGWGAEAARAALSPRPVTPAGNIAGTLELKAEIAALRRERDDALRVAWAVRDLATTPISDADVERAIEEAKRVRQEIEGEKT